MENNSLSHWGIKGMKWGVRRYQNKDGSLTLLGRRRQKKNDEDNETIEECRARLLNSTDASELYKNRSILTTAEINERLHRLDTERRLAQVAESTKKSGMERVDKILKYGRKAEEIYKFANESVIGKAVKKKLFGKVESGLSPDLKKIWDKRDTLSDKTLSDVLKRADTEKTLKKMLDESAEILEKEAAKAKAQKQVDDYNEKWLRGEVGNSSTYHKKGKDIVDSVLDNRTTISEVSGDKKTLALGQTRIAGLLPAYRQTPIAGLLPEKASG